MSCQAEWVIDKLNVENPARGSIRSVILDNASSVVGSFPEVVKLNCQQILLISEGDLGSGKVLAGMSPTI